MPIHDWTRVDAGIFHHFRLCWLNDLISVLNRGLLPSDYYALAERDTRGLGRAYPARDEPEGYALKASSAVIRHTNQHQAIAICDVVSPGNKASWNALRSFVDRAVGLLRGGIHMVVLDLFPPGPFDPQGIHKAIWDRVIEDDFTWSPEGPLTLVSYVGGTIPQAFIEPTAVGAELFGMPLFLTPEVFIDLPLEATYRSAWEDMPSYWREVLSAPAASGDRPDCPERPLS